MSVAQNIAAIRERIAAAAARAGRDPAQITLMAVSKTFPVSVIREAYDSGLRVFGENRVQEFAAKRDELTALAGAEWHMIGHLQSNKANKAVELFSAVDTIDSVALARKLNAAAEKIGRVLPVLVEVNIAGEAAKSGVAPDSAELEEILRAAKSLHALAFRGLMTVPPWSEDPEPSRPYFRKVREMRDRIALRKLPRVGTDVLSIGMSHDFEVAIEEGSTCVRIGTAIFGKRKPR
jgi:pyridoxal phosphate enzyme (YggS family)